MKVYQIKTFSRLTGLSVRSLQYYDTLGLLKPSHKNSKGYRQYADQDFFKLQQILALKLQGLSLNAISDTLARSTSDGDGVLNLLDDVIKERLARMTEAQQLTQSCREGMTQGEPMDVAKLGKLIQLLHNTNNHLH